MFLVTINGEPVPVSVNDAVARYQVEHVPPFDPEDILADTVAQPEIASLLEKIWEDDSAHFLYDAILAEIQAEVARCLREIHQGVGVI